MDPLLSKLITTKSASELSGYTSDYLSRLIRSGKISGKKIGHSWLIDSDSLEVFIEAQKIHKLDRVRDLSTARTQEYLANRSLVRRIRIDLTRNSSTAESGLRPATLQSHALALSLAFAIVISGAIVARADMVRILADDTAVMARQITFGFTTTFGGMSSRLAEKFIEVENEIRARPSLVAKRTLDASSRAASVALAQPDVSFLRLKTDCNESCRAQRVVRPYIAKASKLPQRSSEVLLSVGDILAFVSSPEKFRDTLARAYMGLGVSLYHGIELALGSYRSAIARSGETSFDAAVATRDLMRSGPEATLVLARSVVDLTHMAIRADVAGAYAIAALAPASAEATARVIGSTGAILASIASELPGQLTRAYLALAELPSHVGPAIAKAVFDIEYAGAQRFVALAQHSADSYLDFITTTGRLAYYRSEETKDILTETALAFRNVPAAAQDAYLRTVGKTALAVETVTHIPSLAAALSATYPSLSLGEKVAVTTYETIQGMFSSLSDSLAYIFSPAPIVVVPSSNVVVRQATTTTIAIAPKDSITNTYPTYTTVVQGVSSATLESSLSSLRSDILGSVSGMIRPVAAQTATNQTTIQYVNMIQDLSNLIVRNGDFRGGIFDRGSLTNGVSVAATTGTFGTLTSGSSAITGNLSIAGSAGGTTNLFSISSSTASYATTTTLTVDQNGDLSLLNGANLAVGGNLSISGTSSNTGLASFASGFLSLASSTITSGLFSMNGGASTTQLTTTGATYLATTGGNVGIGTTSPYRSLSVGGSAVFSGGDVLASTITATSSITAASLSLTNALPIASGGTATTTFVNGGVTFYNATLGTLSQGTATSDFFYDVSNKRLGLGTTSPWAQLSVNPDGITGPSFAIGSSSNSHFVVTNEGRVGIGTTSPSSALAVSGNVMLSGTTGATLTGVGAGLTFTGTGNHDITAAGGTLRIGSNTIIGNIEALDDTVDIGTPGVRFDKIYANEVNASTIVGTLTGGNLTAETFTINYDNLSDDTENGYLAFERGSVSPNATFSWNAAGSAKRFEMNQPLFIQNASASTTLTTFDLKSVAGQTADIFRIASSSGTDLFNFSASGKLGLGTSSPWAQLSINPDIANGTAPAFVIGSSSETNFIVTNAGYVGIGTSAPETSLHIARTDGLIIPVGTTAQRPASTLAGIIRYNTSNSTFEGFNGGTWGSLGGVIDTDQDTYVSAENAPGEDNDELKFYTGGTQRGIFSSTGNLGLGTTSPFAKLSLAGSAGGTTNLFAISTSTAGYATTTALTIDRNGNLSLLNGANLTVAGATALASTTMSGQLLLPNGNASSPSLGFSSQTNTGLLYAGDNILRIVSAGAEIASFQNSAGYWSRLKNVGISTGLSVGGSFNTILAPTYGAIFEGTVGIGTSTPSAKLFVQGAYGGTTPLFDVASTTSVGFATSSLFTVLANGKVGVGTSTPNAKLSVQGGAYIGAESDEVQLRISAYGATQTNNIFEIERSTDGANFFQINGSGTAVFSNSPQLPALTITTPGSGWSTSGGESFLWPRYQNKLIFRGGSDGYDFQLDNGSVGLRITNPGNIGIGTTSPFANLSIAGAAGGTTNLFAISTSTAGYATTTALTVDQNGNLSLLNGAGLTVGGNLTITGTTAYTGLSTFTNGFLSFASSTITSGLFSMDGGASTTQLTTTGSTYLATSGGNVGIGTTSPLSLFSVGTAGNAFRVDTTGTVKEGIWNGTTIALANGGTGTTTMYNGGVTFYNSTLGTLSQGTAADDFFYDVANKRLGLGTSSPYAQLSINPTTANGTAPAFVIGSSTATNFIVTNAGRVGVGTTSPAYTLDVNGTSRNLGLITQNIALSGSHGSIITAAVGSSTGYTNFSGGIGTGGSDSIGGPFNNALRLTHTGNLVNIGAIQAGEMNLTRGGTFATKADYTTGTDPMIVAMGDVNGDGKADLAVGNYTSATVSVFLNTGNGAFATKVDYTTGTYPRSVAIGDVNGDGKADLVAANYGSNSVSVLLNNGNGTFATKVDYTAGGNPWNIAIGDVNGDGKADLATANYNSNSVSVLLNNGNGTFAAKVDYTTGSEPRSVAIGDVNGDGEADLATANYNSNSVSVLLNNGNGIYAAKVDYTTGTHPYTVAIGDVNGDGKADLAVANEGSTSVSVFFNNGNGTFATRVNYTTGTDPKGVAIGDVNGDGKADLVAANSGGTSASVLLNNGLGTFATKVDYITGSYPWGVAIGDVNGDGKSDLVTANYGSDTVSVLLNNATPMFYAQASTGNVGIGTTSPFANLSIAGAAGGATNLFAISTSTAGYATTTALTVDQNGNLSLLNGANLSVAGTISATGLSTFTNGFLSLASSTITSGLFSMNGGASTTQLTTTGSTYLATTGGNVGIGTTSPFAQLSIATPNGSTGSLRTLFAIASSTQAGATTTLFSITNQGVVTTRGTTASGNIFNVTDANGNSQFYVGYNGYVTAGQFFNSTFGLDVINSGNYLTRVGQTGVNTLSTGRFGFSSANADQAVDVAISRNAAGVLEVNNGTRGSLATLVANTVGLGTTSPFAKLSLAGSAGGTTNLFAISTSTAGYATTTALTVDQNGNLSLLNGANLSVAGTISATGLSTFTNGFLSLASSTITSGLFSMDGGASTTQLTTTGSTYLATTGGNVGIGTTSPLSLFSVGTAGNAFRVDTTGTVKEGIWNGTAIALANGGTGTTTMYNGGVTFYNSTLGTLSQGTASDDFFYDVANKRLGLGTSSPYAQLSINPTTANGTAPAFVIGSSTATNFIVSNAGNVGIGSTSPSTKLALSGGSFDLQQASSEGTLGSEMISNVADRDFSSDTGNWTGTNWSIGSGVATHVAGNNAFTLANGALTSAPVANSYYQITFSINTTATGSPGLSVRFGGTLATPRYGVNADGSQTSQVVVVKAVSTGALIITPNNATWTGTIDNVSIKEITPASIAQIIRNSDTTAGLEFRAGGTSLNNTFMGVNAGVANITGTYNSAVGNSALYANTSAHYNSAVGSSALYANTTGNYNSAVGSYSLYFNTTGAENSALGLQSLYNNTTGSYNSAIGTYSLYSNTKGTYNSALGYQSLYSNTTGYENAAVGYLSLYSNTTGYENAALGKAALYLNTTGRYNAAVGLFALSSNTTGESNSAIGYNSGSYLANGSTANETSSNSVFLGYGTRASVAGGTNEVVIGASAIGNGSNSVTLGNTSITKTILQGKIGIGTTTPFANLSLAGSAGGTTNLFAISTSTAGFATTTALTVNSNGNLSLLNGANLSVAGTISATGLSTFTNGFLSLASSTITSGLFSMNGGASTTQLTTTGSTYLATTGGNVGIGTTSPYAQLSINPTTANGTAPAFVVGSSTATNFIVTNAGNVGIGTAAPASKLDILGASTSGTLGSEMISNAADRDFSSDTGNWTGTNWSIGSSVATHAAGNNAYTLANGALTSAPVSGNYYQITFSINTTATGTPGVSVTFGGTAAVPRYGVSSTANQTNQIVVVKAISTGALTITPNNATWTGTVDNVSIMQITPASIVQTIRNSDTTAGLEFRAGGTSRYSTFMGVNAGVSNITGNYNSAVGYSALYSNTTGSENSANGYQSLYSNTTASSNSAQGFRSLYSNTTGDSNSAFGGSSLSSNTTGYENSAVGYISLFNNTTGYENAAVGFRSLYANTTGYRNSALGNYALGDNTTGYQNAAVGSYSLSENTTGYYNSALGYQSLYTNTTGYYNSAVGRQALSANTTGYYNSAFGVDALNGNTTGNFNSALGVGAGRYIAASSDNQASTNSVFFGYNTRASVAGGDNEVVIGASAVGNGSNSVTLGNTSITKTILQGKIGIGTTTPFANLSLAGSAGGTTNLFAISTSTAGYATTTALTINSNGNLSLNNGAKLTISSLAAPAGTFLAADANGVLIATSTPTSGATVAGADTQIQFNDGGSALGALTGFTFTKTNAQLSIPTNGWYSIGGNLLAYASSTNQSTIFGLGAGGQNATTSATLKGNTAVGYNALNAMTTGAYNSAVGWNAMAAAVVTGSYNNGLGRYTLYNLSSGTYNNAIGDSAMSGAFVTGSYNNAIGYQALRYVSSGTNNNAFGNNAMPASQVTGSNNNALGQNSLFSATSALYNTGIGYQSLYNVTTGYDNIMLGQVANTGGNNITTGSNNILLGYNAGLGTTTSSRNFLNIGNSFFGIMNATTTATSLPTDYASVRFGIGSSSPWGMLSVNPTAGLTGPAFVIGSSTATNFIVTNAGNVGIGTTSPGFNSGATRYMTVQSQLTTLGLSSVEIIGNAASIANQVIGRIDFNNNNNSGGSGILDTNLARISSGITSNTNRGYLAFSTNNSGGITERMRIAEVGYVGVGTTSPFAKFSLHANNGETATTLFAIASSTSSATTTLLSFLNNGNLGLGTTTPSRRLSVTDTVATSQFMIAYDATRYGSMQIDASGNLVMTTSGGNVTLPDDNMNVCQGDACPTSTATSTAGNLFVENAVTIGDGFSLRQVSATELGLYNASGAMMVIFDNGL